MFKQVMFKLIYYCLNINLLYSMHIINCLNNCKFIEFSYYLNRIQDLHVLKY